MVGQLGHMKAALAGGHVVLVRRPCMLGYISRGFVTIVMKRPGLPRPLKGLPALNDLEPKRRGSSGEFGLGHCIKELQDKYAIHWFYLHSSCLSAHPGAFLFFTFNTHIWLTCLYRHTLTEME